MATVLKPAINRGFPRLLSLSRITSSGIFIPEIDGLRFIAIFAVVAFHIYEYSVLRFGPSSRSILSIAILNGQRGVPLFFVISGFILGRPFAAHYIRGASIPKLKEYYWRRVTRLEPPYLLALILVFTGLTTFSKMPSFGDLFASIIYSHGLIFGDMNPFYGLAWSLEVEVQFYCLIPLLAKVYMLRRPWRRLLLLALMLAGIFHWMPMPSRVSLSLLGWIQCFAAGMLFADIYTDKWNGSKHWVFDFLSSMLWPLIFLVNDKLAWIALPALALIIYMAAFRSFLFQSFFALPLISTIGGMCYTIYLVHYPMISFAGRIFHDSRHITIFSFVFISVASVVFFVFIERPCMNRHWLEKIFQPPKQKIKAE